MNKFTLIFALITGFTTSSVNATYIDDFTEGEMHIIANSTEVYQTASSAFGGGRSIKITKVGANAARADVLDSYGVYAHSADAGTSATSIITWTSTLGIDLIESVKNNAFSLDILHIDLGSLDFTLSVTDYSNSSDTFSLSNAKAGIQNIAFTSFTGINFDSITEISLQIEAGKGYDLAINSLSTAVTSIGNESNVSAVPVPPSLILFTSSLALLSISRRKA